MDHFNKYYKRDVMKLKFRTMAIEIEKEMIKIYRTCDHLREGKMKGAQEILKLGLGVCAHGGKRGHRTGKRRRRLGRHHR